MKHDAEEHQHSLDGERNWSTAAHSRTRTRSRRIDQLSPCQQAQLPCRYFEGLAAWQFWSAPGSIVRGRNRAGQTYDPEAKTVENYAEIAGPEVHVKAYGTFACVVSLSPAHRVGTC